MANIKGCFSSKTDDWKTPQWLFDLFMDKGFVDCFPYQSTKDELLNSYYDQKLFINPPYSKMKLILPWLIRAICKNKVALLIPVRSDTKYWHKLMEFTPYIIFIEGRLHFNDSDKVAPFPSALLLFNYNDYKEYNFLTPKGLIEFIEEYL